MTERTKGLWWIIGGSIALLFTIDLLIQAGLVGLGLWMIDRGMRLRGNYSLFERIRAFLHTL